MEKYSMQSIKLIAELDIALEERRAGDYLKALSRLELLEKQSSNPADIAALQFFQATCLTDLSRAHEALTRITQIDKRRLDPAQQIDYEYEYARIERALGRPLEALRIVKRAIEIIAHDSIARNVQVVSGNLNALHGILLAENGDCDSALPILKAVPMQDAAWVEARLREGDCRYKSGLYREAILCYQSILSSGVKIHPFHVATAVRNIGFAHYDLGDFENAVSYLKRVAHAYEDEPDMKAELFTVLALSYSRLGMIQESRKYGGLVRGSHLIQ